MAKNIDYLTNTHPKTLLLGIEAPYNRSNDIQSYFDEFVHLVRSNNIAYDETLFIKLREVDTGYFLTKGKLEEIRAFCEEHKIEEVVVSESLSSMQERNLSALFHCRVFDRTQLILEIFEKSAHSAEGKMQVAIAMLQHKKTRVAGTGLHMSQQSGHIGGKGPGETAKEKALRNAEEQIVKFKSHLKQLETSRETQRKRRLESGIIQFCLIGYTNTGKSTILNQLTHADVLAEDRLFATLDTTTREIFVGGKKKGVISDTVGFIQQLPPKLINAFKSTLSELQYADLLLHVVDAADKNWEGHIKVVNTILQDLKVQKPVLYVFNKVDSFDKATYKIADEATKAAHAVTLKKQELYQPQVRISARSKTGIEPLIDFLGKWEKID